MLDTIYHSLIVHLMVDNRFDKSIIVKWTSMHIVDVRPSTVDTIDRRMQLLVDSQLQSTDAIQMQSRDINIGRSMSDQLWYTHEPTTMTAYDTIRRWFVYFDAIDSAEIDRSTMTSVRCSNLYIVYMMMKDETMCVHTWMRNRAFVADLMINWIWFAGNGHWYTAIDGLSWNSVWWWASMIVSRRELNSIWHCSYIVDR